MRRALARLTVMLVVLAAVASLARALVVTRSQWRFVRRHRSESLAATQDRLFGRDYMAAVRAIRERVPETDTLYLVDGQSHERGACYFVLHDLAPRPVVYLGTYRSASLRHLREILPRPAQWVVEVGDAPQPPNLMTAREYRGHSRHRGRRSRPSPHAR